MKKKIARTFRKNWCIYSFVNVSWHFNVICNVLLSENAHFVRAFRVKLKNCRNSDISYAAVYALRYLERCLPSQLPYSRACSKLTDMRDRVTFIVVWNLGRRREDKRDKRVRRSEKVKVYNPSEKRFILVKTVLPAVTPGNLAGAVACAFFREFIRARSEEEEWVSLGCNGGRGKLDVQRH